MNDEELRAFLDSATVGNDKAKAPGSDAAESPSEALDDAPEAPVEPRRAVPSFDELMNMSTPEAGDTPSASTPKVTTQPAASPVDAARGVDTPLPAAPVASAQEQEWSPAYAQDNEQLVPLILPGFSPEPNQRRDLPPVFQAESQAAQDADAQHFDPAPTQPFDVLASETDEDQADPPQSEVPTMPTAAPLAAATAAMPAATNSVPTPGDDPLVALVAGLDSPEAESDEYERISVVGSEPRGRKALPWVIVGGGALIAIIASIFVINGVQGSESPAPSEPPAATSEPSPSETASPTPTSEPSEEPEPELPTVPAIDPGSTWTLPIEQWDMTVEISEKLGGSTPYTLFDNNTRMMFDSLPVAAGISEACPTARAEHAWGLLKNADGTLEVIRPEPRCTSPSDAAVYDTIWGVLDYSAKSAKAV